MTSHTTILFDIDGTLIDTHGAGRDAFMHAVCEALDIDDDLQYVSFAGATDLNLFRTICERHGQTFTSKKEQRFFQLLEKYLSQVLSPDNVELLPGVIPLLDTLHTHPEIQLGLLTGNVENCARLKLAPHDLNRYFPFGAYGNEFAVRADIAHKAKERAIQRAPQQQTRIIVIGDTPLDVLAAHAIDAACIAVATGHHPKHELQSAQAEYTCPDLTQTTDLLNWILSGGN